MSDLFLSRISLRADPSVATLAPILFDAAGRHRSEASRRLVWTLFADREDRTRDFLWREDDARRFYVLSSRPPEDRHQLFTRRDESIRTRPVARRQAHLQPSRQRDRRPSARRHDGPASATMS